MKTTHHRRSNKFATLAMLCGAIAISSYSFAGGGGAFECCMPCDGEADGLPITVIHCVPCFDPLVCDGYCQSSKYGTPIATAICE